MKAIEDIKILLIQIRREASMVSIERKSFTSHSTLKEAQWVTLDVYRHPEFHPTLLDGYDAFMIGGLSEDPSDSLEFPSHFYPWIENLFRLIKYAIKVKKPGLLSCGGFMLASHMLGADIVIDNNQRELGMYSMVLSDAAKEDFLFVGFPPSFKAVSGHLKSTNNLPDNCQLLVSSERCPIHGFKVKDSPFYAFQFHPEMKCEDLQDRVELYKEKYFRTEADFRKFISISSDTSLANSIISRFIRLVQQYD